MTRLQALIEIKSAHYAWWMEGRSPTKDRIERYRQDWLVLMQDSDSMDKACEALIEHREAIDD